MRVNFHAHWSDRLVNVHPSYTGWGWRLKLSAGPRSEHSNAKRSNVARAPPRHYGRIHPFNSGAALFVWWHLHISIRWWGIKRKAIAFPPLKHMVRGTARTETQFAVMLKALSALPPPCPAMQNGGGFAPTHDHQALAVRLALMEDASHVGTARGLSASCTSRPTTFKTPRRRRGGGESPDQVPRLIYVD